MTSTASARSIRLFEHALVRLAGLPFDAIDSLSSETLFATHRRYEHALHDLRNSERHLADALHALVPLAHVRSLRTELIATRRAIVHAKASTRARLETLLRALDEADLKLGPWADFRILYADFADRLDATERAREALDLHYAEARREGRRRLVGLLADPNFARGLHVASPQLFDRLRRSAEKLRSATVLGKSEHQAELSLLRYATRAALKTSPFSSFGPVGWMRWERSEPPSSIASATIRVVRFNQRRWLRGFEEIRRDEVRRRDLRVERNPTLLVDAEGYRFFAPMSADGVERFCRIPPSRTIERVLSAMKDESVTYRELLERMGSAPDDETSARVLDRLLEVGLLQWALSLSDEDETPTLPVDLRALRQAEDCFATGGIEERIAIVRSWEERLPAPVTSPSRRSTQGERANEPLLFEDCYVKPSWTIPRASVERWIEVLDRLVVAASVYFGERTNEAPLARTLREENLQGRRIPLVALVERVHRARTNTNERAEAPFEKELFRSFDASVVCTRSDEACIDSMRLLERVREAPHPVPHASLSAFLQVCANGRRAVHNGVLGGHGRAFSRFLSSKDAPHRALREDNLRAAGGELCAEITSASLFNGNIHPPLAEFELVVPGGPRTYPEGRQIRPAELEVGVRSDGRPFVWHVPMRRPVRLLWLGFEATSRSGLLEVLRELSLDFVPDPRRLLGPLNRWWRKRRGEPDASAPYAFPRVVVDQDLVLQRRTWIVPKAHLPELEDSAAGYVRLQRFRHEIGLARRIFLSTVQRSDLDRLAPQERDRLRADDRKPQYVDLESAWAVPLLRQAFSRCPRSAVLVEMEPGPEELGAHEGLPHVLETVVQWARDAEAS